MAIVVYQFVIASLRSVHFSLTKWLGVNIIYVTELYKLLVGSQRWILHCLRRVKEKKSLLYDGFAFRIDRVLKSGDILW